MNGLLSLDLGVSKTVFYTVLDWGLGHATRSVPVIRHLINNGFEVIIGGSGKSLLLLKSYYPDLKTVDFPGFSPKYTTKNPIWNLGKQLISLKRSISKEHKALEKLHQYYHFDLVLSDNRYGAWLGDVKSILITHQIHPEIPSFLSLFRSLFQQFFDNWFANFDEIWIPDAPTNLLANPLSNTQKNKEHRYIGHLSSLNKIDKFDFKYDLLIIGSGPEPQKTEFLIEGIKQAEALKLTFFTVGGYAQIENVHAANFKSIATGDELSKLIISSKMVLSRSGYSTIMDLATLGANACFVPTPGQTEQLLLAKNLESKKIAPFQEQEHFDLKKLLEDSKNFTGFTSLETQNDLLQTAIKSL